jgi:hypothetical protein
MDPHEFIFLVLARDVKMREALADA